MSLDTWLVADKAELVSGRKVSLSAIFLMSARCERAASSSSLLPLPGSQDLEAKET